MSESRIHLSYGSIVVKTQGQAIKILQALEGAMLRTYKEGGNYLVPLEIEVAIGKESTPVYVQPAPYSDAAPAEEEPF